MVPVTSFRSRSDSSRAARTAVSLGRTAQARAPTAPPSSVVLLRWAAREPRGEQSARVSLQDPLAARQDGSVPSQFGVTTGAKSQGAEAEETPLPEGVLAGLGSLASVKVFRPSRTSTSLPGGRSPRSRSSSGMCPPLGCCRWPSGLAPGSPANLARPGPATSWGSRQGCSCGSSFGDAC